VIALSSVCPSILETISNEGMVQMFKIFKGERYTSFP
jgi:hypothetical protein